MVGDRITPATATANHRSSPTSTSMYPQAPAAYSSAPMDPNISDQVAAYMRDPSKMIKGMQMRSEIVGIFGSVNELGSNNTKDFNSMLGVQLLVLLGAAACAIGFLVYVVDTWFIERNDNTQAVQTQSNNDFGYTLLADGKVD
ncbi:hypothetical protein Dimus_019536 [Dionaea muscipula]